MLKLWLPVVSMAGQSVSSPMEPPKSGLKPSSRLTSCFVVADVGGTHARLALAVGDVPHGRLLEATIRRYVCADWPSLEAIVADYLKRIAPLHPVAGLVCAIAGYLQDDKVINRNLPWTVSRQALVAGFGQRPVWLINDFEALAYATLTLGVDELVPMIEPFRSSSSPAGTRVVLGPGTGLGSAILIEAGDRVQVLPSEAGQMAMAPGAGRELQLFELFSRRGSYVTYEHVLSGPGLLATYQGLCELDGQQASVFSAPEVSRLALAETEPLAVEAMDIFCGLLGSLMADLALLLGATGGIYLGGGFVPELLAFLPRSSFRQRFFNKGVMQSYLQQIPVWGMQPAEYGMRGAAAMVGLGLIPVV